MNFCQVNWTICLSGTTHASDVKTRPLKQNSSRIGTASSNHLEADVKKVQLLDKKFFLDAGKGKISGQDRKHWKALLEPDSLFFVKK